MSALLGRLGTFVPEEVDQLPGAMRRLIAKTLELSAEFPVNSGETRPTKAYTHNCRQLELKYLEDPCGTQPHSTSNPDALNKPAKPAMSK